MSREKHVVSERNGEFRFGLDAQLFFQLLVDARDKIRVDRHPIRLLT
jgi:hypothetical protein